MSDAPFVETVVLHPHDNICVAAVNLSQGAEINTDRGNLVLEQAVPIGHKIAIDPIDKGSAIRKYGQVIGRSTQAIRPGQWVHSHNLVNEVSAQEYQKATNIPDSPAAVDGFTFEGYRRASGKVGTRNYIAIISTVNCSASVSKAVARHFDQEQLSPYQNVDGVVAFTHNWGCGMQLHGPGHESLSRVLAGMAQHPNIGAYLIIGLGCEQTSIDILVDDYELVQIEGVDPALNSITGAAAKRPPTFTLQDCGGTVKTVKRAIKEVERLLPLANDVTRETVPASELMLATECGGSDGNSGVTCNPAVGIAADRLVAAGGTVILSETSEIYGAEHLMTQRSRTPQVADKLLKLIDWWKWYAGMYGGELDNNPSVGNKAGGLTTIAEKSLGAVAKAGRTALEDVYEYAELVKAKGLVVMDSPGFDAASISGMVAGGANMVVFTTGRGSCYGCKPTPSLKVASNTPMYNRLSDDMDLNAGTILQGASVSEVGEAIFAEILAVASGKKTKSEEHGIGDEEFVPWNLGPIL